MSDAVRIQDPFRARRPILKNRMPRSSRRVPPVATGGCVPVYVMVASILRGPRARAHVVPYFPIDLPSRARSRLPGPIFDA